MYTLQIEHGVSSYGSWRAAYDADPLDRAGSGVLAARVAQPVGDDSRVVVELDFAAEAQAELFLARLRSEVWGTGAAPALRGGPETRILRLLDAGPVAAT
ncbi:MAG: hypothetical protein ABWX68_13750 [Arthrobacter sp.]|uniref:hypothetical protein n=1 Tax=Arthrobacter sp. TaxID=1667 RepID=UPI0034957E40